MQTDDNARPRSRTSLDDNAILEQLNSGNDMVVIYDDEEYEKITYSITDNAYYYYEYDVDLNCDLSCVLSADTYDGTIHYPDDTFSYVFVNDNNKQTNILNVCGCGQIIGQLVADQWPRQSGTTASLWHLPVIKHWLENTIFK